ncbi:MAG: phosphonate metabolism transcriptional regulator PhnF [Pseudomonadota bacterium]
MIRDRWRSISDALRQDIVNGHFAFGDRLPTEPELALAYDAGRHSVRRAVSELAKEGLLSVEQGRGTFVKSPPRLDYNIGRRTRMRPNMHRHGVEPSSTLVDSTCRPAIGEAANMLGLTGSDTMLVTRRITRVDGEPMALVTRYHDAARFPDITERRAKLGSTTATYKSYGIDDYLRERTTIHARLATAEESKQLLQHPDLPVLVVHGLDVLPDRTPISYGVVIWAAMRVQFTVTLDGMD